MTCLKLKIQKENVSFRKAKFKNIFGIWSLEFGHFKNGFTFIELLVVISLMAIVAASVSAAYLNFEKNQRVKEAALMVKNEIRAFQNNASSGKNIDCFATDKLAGWLLGANVGLNSLIYGVDCEPFNGTAFSSSQKTLKLPQGVILADIKYGPVGAGTSITPVYIFYRTLNIGFSFHESVPPLDADTGDLVNLIGGALPQDPVTIILTGSGVTYGVVVMPSGEVYEKQM